MLNFNATFHILFHVHPLHVLFRSLSLSLQKSINDNPYREIRENIERGNRKIFNVLMLSFSLSFSQNKKRVETNWTILEKKKRILRRRKVEVEIPSVSPLRENVPRPRIGHSSLDEV